MSRHHADHPTHREDLRVLRDFLATTDNDNVKEALERVAGRLDALERP